jgi:uncharacterized protein
MKHLLNWIEIPVTDFNRAQVFYSTVLGVELNVMEMHESKMGFFPGEEGIVSGAIVKSDMHIPSKQGCVVYLNGGDDLNNILLRIDLAGGKVIVPKTEISPEMGCFAFFIDTEGNKIGLHSKN